MVSLHGSLALCLARSQGDSQTTVMTSSFTSITRMPCAAAESDTTTLDSHDMHDFGVAGCWCCWEVCKGVCRVSVGRFIRNQATLTV
jgi:hypothetical protein